MSEKKQNDVNMLEGPILPQVLLFTVPLMLSGVLQLMFNAADIAVVGRFAGSQSLAAVSSTSSLIGLITNLFIGLSVGSNVVVAQGLGAGRDTTVRKAVSTAILIALVGGLILAAVGGIAAGKMLTIMAVPDDVISLSTLYLRIYFLGMPAIMVYNYGASILRAKGDTRHPLYYLTVAGVLNVVMNLFFVIVMKLDVAGVALATILSQYVSAVLVILLLIRERSAVHFDFKHPEFDKDAFKEIFRIGLPAGLQGTLFSISNVTIQASINSFGSTVMAGNGAASNLEGFVYVSMNAFYQACLSFTGQNIGAGKKERIGKILKVCLLCVLIGGGFLGLTVHHFSGTLLKIYSTDPEVIAAGRVRTFWNCQFYALCGMMDVMGACNRGLGYSIMPMIVSLLGVCALRLLWVATVFAHFHTIEILYISYPVSWTITFIAHLICYLIVRKKI